MFRAADVLQYCNYWIYRLPVLKKHKFKWIPLSFWRTFVRIYFTIKPLVCPAVSFAVYLSISRVTKYRISAFFLQIPVYSLCHFDFSTPEIYIISQFVQFKEIFTPVTTVFFLFLFQNSLYSPESYLKSSKKLRFPVFDQIHVLCIPLGFPSASDL